MTRRNFHPQWFLIGLLLQSSLVACGTGGTVPTDAVVGVGGAATVGGATATANGGTGTGNGGAANGGAATGGAPASATGGAPAPATGGAPAIATGGAPANGGAATGGKASTGGATTTTTGGATTTTGGATTTATGGATTTATGGATTTATGGAATTATGGGTGTAGFGVPLCVAGETKGGPCTVEGFFCYKTCGPASVGRKTETCTGGLYVEGACIYDPAGIYTCYAIPATPPTVCPTTAPQASTACLGSAGTPVPACTVCGGTTGYLDSTGAVKIGYCVCGTTNWSCASSSPTNAWPCPGNPGC